MRDRCAGELRELGFAVREIPFEFSGFPGRLATPLLAGIAALVVGFAGRWHAHGRLLVPATATVLGAALLFVVARWLARDGVLATPVMRERGVNLEAVRGGTPTVWVCAHVDSKSQPVPTLLRSSGIVLEVIGYAMTLALAVSTAFGARLDAFLWDFAAVVTLVGAIPVVLSIVGKRSPGALDNASGVVTVISAVRQLSGDQSVGVLLSDGEELGLAGARAWAKTTTQRTRTVLNCDGVDDIGGIQVMFSGRRPSRLLDAIARASRASNVRHGVSRIIPGVLTDSVAFTDAGMDSVTFSRGTFRSLVRVHTRRDDTTHLAGTGIAETAALIAATAGELERGNRGDRR